MSSEFVELAGARLEVLRHGPVTRPTLVFLHEGLGCAAMWRTFPQQLGAALGLGAVVYSRAGYGRSSPVPAVARSVSYLGEQGPHELVQLLDALALEDVILIGHSDGASIALAHAAAPSARPRLRGVVALAPHTFVEDLTLASIRQARQAYLEGGLHDRLQRHHGEQVDGAFWGWNGMWLDPEFATWSLLSELPRIDAPVLALQGRDDEYGTLRQLQVLHDRCRGPVETVVLEECGHAPQRDQGEATHAAIVGFVGALTGA